MEKLAAKALLLHMLLAFFYSTAPSKLPHVFACFPEQFELVVSSLSADEVNWKLAFTCSYIPVC